MLYALIDAAAAVLRYEDFAEPPPSLAPDKGLTWRAVEDVRPAPGDGEILDGLTVTVEADRVVRVWTMRAKTYGERLAEIHAARRAAYPPVGDQLDAAFKARAGNPADQIAVDAAVAAVKAAYPKPAT